MTGRGSRIIGELFLRGTEKGRGSRIIEEQLSGVTGGGSRGGRPSREQVRKGRKMSLPVYILIYFWGSNGPQRGRKIRFQ